MLFRSEENAQLVYDAFSLGPSAKVWTPGLPNLGRDITRLGKSRILVWSKKFAAAGNGLGGASTWEPILVVGHTPTKKLKNDVIEIMTERENVDGVSLRKLHTCPNPVALYAALACKKAEFACVYAAVISPFTIAVDANSRIPILTPVDGAVVNTTLAPLMK